MACDPNDLLEGAKCYLACIPPGYAPYAEIAILCAIRDGDTSVCGSTDSLIQAATCLSCSITPGMVPYVRMAILCEILSA